MDLKGISEYDWQVALTRHAENQGWKAMYFRRTATQGKNGWVAIAPAGWPDLLLVRNGRVVCIECKAERGTVSQAQLEWLRELGEVPGISTYIFKPRDASEAILRLK